MFQKILVAVGEGDREVFDRALDLAKSSQASLMLLHVLTVDADDEPDFTAIAGIPGYSLAYNQEVFRAYQERWERREKEGIALLQTLSQVAIEAGVKTEFTQNPGAPGRTICTVAKTWGADLIVMGRRGLGGLKELVLGSSSNYVLHHAPCSVLVVQRTQA